MAPVSTVIESSKFHHHHLHHNEDVPVIYPLLAIILVVISLFFCATWVLVSIQREIKQWKNDFDDAGSRGPISFAKRKLLLMKKVSRLRRLESPIRFSSKKFVKC